MFVSFRITAKVTDRGKYMVRAVNSGGEAQSIADFAVLEPTPERMVEVVKTVVFDDISNMAEPTVSDSNVFCSQTLSMS